MANLNVKKDKELETKPKNQLFSPIGNLSRHIKKSWVEVKAISKKITGLQAKILRG